MLVMNSKEQNVGLSVLMRWFFSHAKCPFLLQVMTITGTAVKCWTLVVSFSLSDVVSFLDIQCNLNICSNISAWFY